MIDMNHMNYLERVVAEDVRHLQEKERTYGGSWKKRGGVGAFMMLARKWDRLENMLASKTIVSGNGVTRIPYDIFAAIQQDMSGADGTPLAELRDLRRYLTLVEAEMISVQDRARGGKILYGAKGPIEVFQAGPDQANNERLVPRYPDISSVGKPEDGLAPKNESSLVGKRIVWVVDGETYIGTVLEDNENETYVKAYIGEDPGNKKEHWYVSRLNLVKKPDPVPAEDSNRHAERRVTLDVADQKAFRQDKDGRWVAKPLISAEVYRNLSLKARTRFILLGKNAIVDRNQWTQEERDVASRYSQTMPKHQLDGMPLWIYEMYEPRTGVEGEVQLKEPYRELWGR